MKSYINMILDSEAAKERLQSMFRTAPDAGPQSQVRPAANHGNEKRSRSLQPLFERLASSPEMVGRYVRQSRLAAHGGSLTIEASVWLVSYMLAILGLVKAAYSEQPLLWLAMWPAPIVLVSTIFIFSRQGFHHRDGVFVLGRRGR